MKKDPENITDITKFVEKDGNQYYINKNEADQLGIENGDNIVIKLGGWFNKIKGYVAETLPKSDKFHIIPYKDMSTFEDDKKKLNEEIERAKKLMKYV